MQGSPFRTAGTVLGKAARRVNSTGQRWRVNPRAAAKTPEKYGWPDSASSSFSLPADGKKPHHLQQQKNAQTVDFKLFFSLFSDLIFLFFLLRSAASSSSSDRLSCTGDDCWRPEQRVAPLGKGAVTVGFSGRWVSSSSPLFRVADRWLGGEAAGEKG